MPGTAGLVDPFQIPGMGTPQMSAENEFLWGNRETVHLESGIIVSTATDSGGTPTTNLRPGLLMGVVTASGKWRPYSPTATDGSQVVKGVLRQSVNMLDVTGTAADKMAQFVIAGFVKNGSLYNLDAVARGQMRNHFLFDDEFPGYYSPEFVKEVAKTADYTVTAADRGTLFTNVGATGTVIFTLPALAAGLKFGFLVVADFTLTVASVASDDMVVFNDASADSVSFSTGGQKVGGKVVVECNAAGTKWYVENRSAGTNTVSVAT